MADERGPAAPGGSTTQELLALIDRLEELLQRSDLAELEVRSGDTTLVLRTPSAVAPAFDAALLATLSPAPGAVGFPMDPAIAVPPGDPPGMGARGSCVPEPGAEPSPARHAVVAPLTGIFYASPTPEAAPYVQIGSHVQQGQVIGLIEAMKLFNEIKSDASGTVTRIVAESGTLVKAKAPLIELEPA